MEKVEEFLPGITAFITVTLLHEKLSASAEKARLHYVELLDVLQLQAAPCPPVLPVGSGRSGRLSEPVTSNVSAVADGRVTGAGRPAVTAAVAQRVIAVIQDGHGGSHADEADGNLYNEVDDISAAPATDNRTYAKKDGNHEYSDEDDYNEAYEEPINWESKPNKDQSLAPKSAQSESNAASSDDSSTDYEAYSNEDEEEPGEVVAGDDAFNNEPIVLPRVKSKKKKKKPVPAFYQKSYGSLTERQYEGEMCMRGNIKWARRLCVISENALLCYKDAAADSRPLTYVALSGYDVFLSDKDKGRSNVLRLSRPGRETLFFSCDSAEAAYNWSKYLSTATGTIPVPSAGSANVNEDHDLVQSWPSRSTSDEGDYRVQSCLQVPSSSYLSKSPPAINGYPDAFGGSPRAAPRKSLGPVPDNKKKGKITKFLSETFGKKKGQLVLLDINSDQFSSEYGSSTPRSSNPDIVIAGVVSICSRLLASHEWHDAYCVVRSSGVFECYCDGAWPTQLDVAVDTTANLSIALAGCEIEQASEKERPLAMSLLKGGELQLTFTPCERLEHGSWLSALLKHVGLGGGTGGCSSSSSTTSSGDGVIQHNNYVNGTAVTSDMKSRSELDPSSYVNVPAASRQKCTAAATGLNTSDDEAHYDAYEYVQMDEDGFKDHKVYSEVGCEPQVAVQQLLGGKSNSTGGPEPGSSSLEGSHGENAEDLSFRSPVLAKLREQKLRGLPSALLPLHDDAVATNDSSCDYTVILESPVLDTAKAISPTASLVLVQTMLDPEPKRKLQPVASGAVATSEKAPAALDAQIKAKGQTDIRVGGGGNSSMLAANTRGTVLHVKTQNDPSVILTKAGSPGNKSPLTSPLPIKESSPVVTPLSGQHKKCTSDIKLDSGPHVTAARAVPSAAVLPNTSSISTTRPEESERSFASAAVWPTSGTEHMHASAMLELAPKKLAIAGNIAKNRAMFEGGTGTGIGNKAAAEGRWPGYKLAGANNIISTASPGGSRRRSSGGSEGDSSLPALQVSASTAAASGVATTSGGVNFHAKSVHCADNTSVPKGNDNSVLAQHSKRCSNSSDRSVSPASQPSAAALTKHSAPSAIASNSHSKSSSFSSESSLSSSGGFTAARFGTPDSDSLKKAEARLFLGTVVNKLECSQDGLHPASSSGALPRGGAGSDEDMGDKKRLEELREQRAELRKQRAHLRVQKNSAAGTEKVRWDSEYKSVDEKCREVERLVDELEDANLMRIKTGKR